MQVRSTVATSRWTGTHNLVTMETSLSKGDADQRESMIQAQSLWIGNDAEPIPDGAVLIRGDGIVAVGSVDQVSSRASPTANRHSFPGHTIMPGLIDCHVHLCFPG